MVDENEPAKPIQPGDLPEATQLPAAPLAGAPVPGAQLPAPSTLPAAPVPAAASSPARVAPAPVGAAAPAAVASTAPDALYPSGKITSGSQNNRQQRLGPVLIVVVLMVATAALILGPIATFAERDTSSDLTGQVVRDLPITEPIPGTVRGAEEQEPRLPVVDATSDGAVGFDTPVPVSFRVTGDANGSVWNVALSEPYDVTDLLVDAYDYNEPPPDGVRFIGFDLEMTLASAVIEPLTTGVIVDWELLGTVTDRAYNTGTIAAVPTCGAVPNEFNNFAPTFVGGTLSGLVCLPLPAQDASETSLDVLLKVGDERIVFSRNGASPEPAKITESLGVTSATERGYDAPVPLELGNVFGEAAGSTWNVAVGEPTDITDQVLNYNSYNDDPPPGFAFAGFDVELTLASANVVPIHAGSSIRWEIIGGETLRVYDIGTVEGVFGCGNIEGEMDSSADLFVGGMVSGLVCIPVPIQDLDHPDTQVAIKSGGERTVFRPVGPTPAPAELASQGGPSAVDDQQVYGEPVSVHWDSDDPASPTWIATVGQWADMTEDVVAESVYNVPPPAGFAFVVFDAKLSLESTETSRQSPGFSAHWELLGGETLRVYRPASAGNFLGCGLLEGEFDRSAEVSAGESITGTVCIPVPAVDLENAATRLALDTPGGRVVFGPAE